MSDIRKISVGTDYKNTSMHYIVGQDVLGDSYKIHLIQAHDNGSHYIWIKGDGEVILWKSFNKNMPVTLEYNINF
jgi:hypothetical protein